MPPLSPTLWRTCRVLSGPVRLQLLRTVMFQPGFNVSTLAQQADVGISDASQELRRIQSRGLVRRTTQGRSIIYLPTADPLVSSAAPLLKALRSAWKRPGAQDARIARIAKGLACERRVNLVRALAKQPQPLLDLAGLFRTNHNYLYRHLQILTQSGWIIKQGHLFRLCPATHPVHVALLGLL